MATASSSGLSSVLAGGADTIVARATPAGRGALAVIRLSGPACFRVGRALCAGLDESRSWHAQLVTIAGERAVAVPFRAPRTFTGEDMLELTVHGAPYLVRRLLETCLELGCRPADPGEFTRRAVANGKMDLLQAEGLRDLVAAETEWQARLARAQAGGELSRRMGRLRERLVDLLARVEAALDFAAQEIVIDHEDLERRRRGVMEELGALLAGAAVGERVREGLRLVILGPPNAGKSTLFNGLLRRERAIVAPHPGTTRDVLEAGIEVAGVPVVVVDTAGLGAGGDALEVEAQRRTRSAMATAGAVLWLHPADDPGRPEPPPLQVPWIGVLSRADLAPARRVEEPGWQRLSLTTGEGWEELSVRLEELALGGVADLGGEVAIAARHRVHLESAAGRLQELDLAAPELAAEDLRAALGALAELTGEVADGEVLEAVFATFCLGK